ncbi:hypothetical protein EDD28_2453 [Salana multivorans]|uniref:Uncharacterized protein n=1 Tax=Salana multivorans TaxID=120377 RepID=A0A3N2DEJ0_9MICO|nr:hypothetical protein [Salana multivorans]ROR94019.1 hypothetical protein EDD28_3449 [Salana multivorans]ROR97844.1 hypothetical protein EDD28_2453 [Salana multivorans]
MEMTDHSESHPSNDVPPPVEAAPNQPRRRGRTAIIVGVTLVALCAIIAIVRLGNRATPLESAVESCGLGDKSHVASLRDGGRTLLLDNKGEEDVLGLDVFDIACVLDELHAPSSVIAKMDSTRALDGMQSASWGNIEATWSYHPSNGLDLILEMN